MTECDKTSYYYCEDCAFELSYTGSRVVPLIKGEGVSKMQTEAKEYLKVCDDIIQGL